MDFEDFPLNVQRAIDQACDEFEAELRAGEDPRPEDYLVRVPDAARAALRELLRELADDHLRRPADGPPPPTRFGRYAVDRELGRGGFAVVYLARDEQLNREVALKVPHPEQAGPGGLFETLMDEAAKIAGLKHPGIVTLHDVCRADDGTPFLVLEYVEGRTLEDVFRDGRPDPAKLAGMLADVADAMHYAFKSGLVHRDLKPRNILLDRRDRPKVADFGLAQINDPFRRPSREVAGTLKYMAPEQVLGETHRLDGRTDVWAIGVMLYRGLTGRLPFPGVDAKVVSDEVLNRQPTPPRQFDDLIPREIERICLRCLSKRMEDRYLTAADLADDLKSWLGVEPTPSPVPLGDAEGATPQTASPTPTPFASTFRGSGGVTAVMPPRPEASDAGPPPVTPRGLRAFDRDDAGFFLSLLPGLRGRGGVPESVRFWKDRVEATEGDKAFPVGLLFGPSGGGKSSFVRAGLLPSLAPTVRPVYVEATPETTEARLLAGLRAAAPGLPPGADLPEAVAAVRKGEAGVGPDKVLLVIDQFEQWLQANREDGSAPLVRALRQCDGVKVQALVLVRDEFWLAVTRLFRALEVPQTYGLNVRLAEPFDARHARAVLESFGRAWGRFTGPGGAPSAAESAFLDEAVAGLAGSDGRVVPVRLCLLAEVVRGREWSPATLTDLGGVEGVGVRFLEEAFDAPTAPPVYKAHRKAAKAVLEALLPGQASTLMGSARPASALRAAAGYGDKPAEFAELIRALDSGLRMITLTDSEGTAGAAPGEPSYRLAHDHLVAPIRHWIEKERLSTREGRSRSRLTTITALWRERPEPRRLPSPFEWAGILRDTDRKAWKGDERRMMAAASRRYLGRAAVSATAAALLAFGAYEFRQRVAAEALVEKALAVPPAHVRGLFQGLDESRGRVTAVLARKEASSPDARPRATLLLHRYDPTDARAEALRVRLTSADPDEAGLVSGVLAQHPDRRPAEAAALWAVASAESAGPAARLRAASALAALDPSAGAWAGVAPAVARAMAAVDPGDVHRWVELLRPAAGALAPALADAGLDPTLTPAERAAAADTFGAIGPDDRTLAPLWPRLRHAADARPRAALIDALSRLRANPRPLIDRVSGETDPGARQGVLMALAEMVADRPPPPALVAALDAVAAVHRDDPDPGVHSAAGLLLSRTGRAPAAPALGGAGAASPPPGRLWFAGPNGHEFAVVGPLEGWVGSPDGEPDRERSETRHYRKTGRRLAVATAETSVGQLQAFGEVMTGEVDRSDSDPKATADRAAHSIPWFQAARYCNLLSKTAGIPPEQWCYPDRIGPGMTVPDDAVDREGFRLPTEAEWELLCRAGTATAWPFGDREDLLPRYAWTPLNSGDRVRPVGRLLPNGFGLFDVTGNVWEWCHDGPDHSAGDTHPPYPEGSPDRPAADRPKAQTLLAGGTTDADVHQTYRGIRGGSFDYPPTQSRSPKRYFARVNLSHVYIGFRVVRTLPTE